MTENQWLVKQLKEQIAQTDSYQERAFLLGLCDLLEEQEKRIERLQGQLDGTLWSPSEWNI